MITIDDKISSFQKIINEDISEKAQKEIDEYILETEEKVSKYKEKKYESTNQDLTARVNQCIQGWKKKGKIFF